MTRAQVKVKRDSRADGGIRAACETQAFSDRMACRRWQLTDVGNGRNVTGYHVTILSIRICFARQMFNKRARNVRVAHFLLASPLKYMSIKLYQALKVMTSTHHTVFSVIPWRLNDLLAEIP